MANLLRRPSSKDKYKDRDRDIVGHFKKPDSRCKKHPKHRQSPGVCSLCLTEKLNQVSTSTSSSRKTTLIAANSSSSSSVSSLSSYYSSSWASSCASPVQRRFDRGKSTFSSSISFFLLNHGKHGQLTKSRTVAAVPGRKDGEGGVNIKSNKKGGFWHKLLHPKSKRMKENDTNKLVHSSSVRERAMVAS